jgi:hypothetical protein
MCMSLRITSQCVIQTDMKRPTKTQLQISLDRSLDRPVSSGRREVSYEGSFEAAAGSAPPNQGLGNLSIARQERRATASIDLQPLTPNDWIEWLEIGFSGEEERWKQ